MRLALISDLHGNALALQAVLADAARRGVDEIVCLGDVATLGPHPREVIAELRSRQIRCILGNHDEFMLDAGLIHTYTEAPQVVDAVTWCREALTDDDLAYLRAAQRSEHRRIEGVDVLLVHGSPRSHMEEIVATTPDDALSERLDGHRPQVLVGGHTHMQMLRRFDGVTLVNPGSVGAPFLGVARAGPPVILAHTEYATITFERGAFSVSLHHLPLSKAALRDQALRSGHPMADWLAAPYA